jgi:hypothetical protein
MTNKTLQRWGIIKCPSCNQQILTYDIDELSVVDPGMQIRSGMFLSIVEEWPDPKMVMLCPYCDYNYISALRNAWKKERDSIREWDR